MNWILDIIYQFRYLEALVLLVGLEYLYDSQVNGERPACLDRRNLSTERITEDSGEPR